MGYLVMRGQGQESRFQEGQFRRVESTQQSRNRTRWGALLLLLVMTIQSVPVASAPVASAEVSVVRRGSQTLVRVDSELDYGDQGLPVEEFIVLREARSGKVALRLLISPAPLAREAYAAAIVPNIDPASSPAKGLFWEPALWMVSQMEKHFSRPIPGLDVEVILVPAGFHLRHRSRQPISDRGVPMRIAIGVGSASEEYAEFDALWNLQTVALHELTHVFAASASGFGIPRANLVSEEAMAYSFQTCATLAGAELRQVVVASGAPVTPEWTRKAHQLTSRQMFRSYAREHGVTTWSLESSYRGGILAGVALWELLGDERFVLSELSRNRVAAYCDRLLDYRGDWLTARPCAGDKRLAGVCAVHALP